MKAEECTYDGIPSTSLASQRELPDGQTWSHGGSQTGDCLGTTLLALLALAQTRTMIERTKVNFMWATFGKSDNRVVVILWTPFVPPHDRMSGIWNVRTKRRARHLVSFAVTVVWMHHDQ
jgi:hypothetical protein